MLGFASAAESAATARRVERSECRFIVAAARAAAIRSSEPVVIESLATDAAAVLVGRGSPLDKIVGAGFGALDESALARFEATCAARGAHVPAEVASVADDTAFDLFSSRGYRRGSAETISAIDPRRAPASRPRAIDVAIAADDEREAWVDTLIEGFASGEDDADASESLGREALRDVFLDMGCTPGFERWLARRHGQIVGAAGLRLDGELAHLCSAATLPAHRGLGVQSALLAARLKRAAMVGAELAIVTTTPSSRSERNARRAGFERLYERLSLVRG